MLSFIRDRFATRQGRLSPRSRLGLESLEGRAVPASLTSSFDGIEEATHFDRIALDLKSAIGQIDSTESKVVMQDLNLTARTDGADPDASKVAMTDVLFSARPDDQAEGLLLPAVQKVRQAAARLQPGETAEVELTAEEAAALGKGRHVIVVPSAQEDGSSIEVLIDVQQFADGSDIEDAPALPKIKFKAVIRVRPTGGFLDEEGATGGAGKVAMQDLNLTARTDGADPDASKVAMTDVLFSARPDDQAEGLLLPAVQKLAADPSGQVQELNTISENINRSGTQYQQAADDAASSLSSSMGF